MEPLDLFRGDFKRENLDGYGTAEREVLGAKNRAHSALGHLSVDPEGGTQCAPKALDQRRRFRRNAGHGPVSSWR